MLSFKSEFQKKIASYSDYLPFYAQIDESTLLNKDMFFMSVIQYAGYDLDFLSINDQVYLTEKLNEIIMRLGENWGFHFENNRRLVENIQVQEIENPIANRFEKLRGERFNKYKFYENSKFISICYQPQNEKHLVNKFIFGIDNKETSAQKELEYFIDTISKITKEFAACFEEVKILEGSEFLSYLNYTTTLKPYEIEVPENPIDLDLYLTQTDINVDYPIRIGDNFVLSLSISSPAKETKINFLKALEVVDFEYRVVTRFTPYSQDKAIAAIKKRRDIYFGRQKSLRGILAEKKGESVPGNTEETAKYRQMDEALSDIGENRLSFGETTTTIHVYGSDFEQTYENYKSVVSIIKELNIVYRDENIYAFACYRSSIPGEFYANVRKPVLNSYNVAHLISLHSAWTGFFTNSHLEKVTGNSYPHMICRSSDNLPFFLNLNVQDVGHTFVVGQTGAGKSTLLCALELQFLRYANSKIFIFDRDRSAYSLTKLVGGVYYEPACDEIQEGFTIFQPLNIENNISDITYAKAWVTEILMLAKVEVNTSMEKEIVRVLENMTGLKPNEKTLTTFYQLLHDSKAKEVIKKYTKQGQYGYIFDGNNENMGEHFWTMIEMNEVLKRGDDVLIPTLSYLFYKIDKQLTIGGQPTLIIMDEGWQFLRHKIFVNKIEEWLKTLRKKNGYVVICTQEFAEIVRSPLCDVIINSCLTKIYLANPNAKNLIDGYYKFGLSDEEIEVVSKIQPKKYYLFKNLYGSRVFDLDLDAEQLNILRGE